MARRIPEHEGLVPEAQPTATGIPGGASGVVLDANADAFKTTISNPGEASSRAEVPDDAPVVPVKEYRVLNDPPAGKMGYPILYDGCLSQLPKGKIVSENAYDIKRLQMQGVLLEEIK